MPILDDHPRVVRGEHLIADALRAAVVLLGEASFALYMLHSWSTLTKGMARRDDCSAMWKLEVLIQCRVALHLSWRGGEGKLVLRWWSKSIRQQMTVA